jgi:DNA helicase HerA-like ATPase
MATRARKAAPESAAASYGVAAKAHIEAVLGASGSGKSSYVKRLMERARPARMIVFDPEGEWTEFGTPATHVQHVLDGFKAAGKDGPCRVVFVPSPVPEIAVRQFDAVCRIAFHAERLTFIVDELKSVTTPSRSPVGWGMLTGRGRKRGIVIYGLSQRPASIDKDFLGNCNYVRAGRLTYSEDQRAVARVLGVKEADIGALPDLGWIRRDMATGETKRG